jgi:predicted ribosome quality control (RQC) complex YloA/Tae2 family protein
MDGLAIAASLREVRAAVENGFVRSIYQPTKSAFVLHVFAGQNRRILLDPRHSAIHVTGLGLVNPPKPSPFVMLLRRHLRGGRVLAVRQREWDRVVTFDIGRRGERTTRVYELVVELIGAHGNLFLLDGGKVLGSAHRDRRNPPGHAYASLRPQVKLDPTSVSVGELDDLLHAEPAERALTRSIDGIGRQTAKDILRDWDRNADVTTQAERVHASLRAIVACVDQPSARLIVDEPRATFYPLPPPAEPANTFGEALDAVAGALAESREREDSAVRADLLRAMARRTRTLEKLREWLDDAEEADRLQSLADLLMIHHAQVEPKSERVVLSDPMTGREETIRLLPALSAIENAQRLYKRAKRLRRGRPHVTSRIEHLEREIGLLAEAIDDQEGGRVVDGEALALLPRAASRRTIPEPGSDRRGIQIDGFTILIGKSAVQNDRLLREAAADDLWLHAKGFAGSHVIIRRGGRRNIPDAVVQRAARLAAEHSKGRGEHRVEVVVTEAKHVRKPRGVATGLANVLKGDTLTVEL